MKFFFVLLSFLLCISSFADSKNLIFKFKPELLSEEIERCQFSDNEKWLLCSTYLREKSYYKFYIIDTERGVVVKEVENIHLAFFTSDSKYLEYIDINTKELRRLNIALGTNETLYRYSHDFKGEFQSFDDFHSMNYIVVFDNFNETVYVNNINTGNLVVKSTFSSTNIGGAKISKDEAKFIVYDNSQPPHSNIFKPENLAFKKTIRIFNLGTGSLVKERIGVANFISSVDISDDLERIFIFSSAKYTLGVLNLIDGQSFFYDSNCSSEFGHTEGASKTVKYLFCSQANNLVNLVSLENGGVLLSVPSSSPNMSGKIQMSSNDQFISWVNYNGDLIISELSKDKVLSEVKHLHRLSMPMRTMDFLNNDNFLLTESFDNNYHIYSTKNWELIFEQSADTPNINLSISKNGKYISSINSNYNVNEMQLFLLK